MKINEFEDKLVSVSDAKLRQMLSASRANGPEVAVKLILNEAKRRGMDDLDFPAGNGFDRPPGSETSAYKQEMAGYAGADAPPDLVAGAANAEAAGAGAAVATETEGLELDANAPATAPDWLSEETHSGMPMAVKVLLAVVVLGGLLGLAWKATH